MRADVPKREGSSTPATLVTNGGMWQGFPMAFSGENFKGRRQVDTVDKVDMTSDAQAKA